MNDGQIAKIQRFLADEAMCGAVRRALLDAFLKPQKERDVNYLAASRIAIDLLDEGFKSLERFKDKELGEVKISKQVGV